MDVVTKLGYDALDRGVLPDAIVRRAIRYLCRQRLQEVKATNMEASVEAKWAYIQGLKQHQVAIETEKANEQHYEVSTEFIQSCLGPHMKYSCCLYPTGKETLEKAEVLMLQSYCEKAKLEDGMEILDLGCGWGSLSLFLAKKYPNSTITALSNSATQKVHIDSQAALRGLKNLTVFTGDVKVFNDFAGTRSFDRILSIEMFEHMKASQRHRYACYAHIDRDLIPIQNYEQLLKKVSSWLKPNAEAKTGEALLFVHIFCHRDTPYHFEENDGWMSKNFFSGGTMSSFDLFTHFQTDLTLERSWWINGKHYGRTCEDWLKLQDSHRSKWFNSSSPRSDELVTGPAAKSASKQERSTEGSKSFYRFRVFFLACAEFFALDEGESWGVGHYLFKKRD
ncbi:BZ3500_MvSof-1268-A1-R1_Chr1-1g00828 [Microbotryum saponariae]|uniref:BZ3500_MvSof-1268-A1-R1_Chr1-1g00828 protein n=1 Tax=Microbotryum saponariae TaxID=289078 RepID=A0A2X0MF28_9BASI|nr:BZ3500_MvSof-1268-A1-R1_Chr1-1g00828 [Microbotryum saponariae]SCZ92750.1 BZ3501_MvSof-1269-A2-R1_Chr1-1g00425 [Microbotryum saponariae]